MLRLISKSSIRKVENVKSDCKFCFVGDVYFLNLYMTRSQMYMQL